MARSRRREQAVYFWGVVIIDGMEPIRATAVSRNIKPMPQLQKEVGVDGVYSATEFDQISLGFIPRDMDDKWFIYWENGWLSFHRSWTGNCVYQLEIVPDGDGYRAVRAVFNRDPEQYRGSDGGYDVSVISFLIDQVLLHRFAVFPQMRGLSATDQARHKQLMMGDKATGEGGIRLQMKGKT